jgi:hypothetical protein
MNKFKIYALYTFISVCFISCSSYNKHADRHENRIDSIQVVTLQEDTVWIFSRGGGHTIILPNNYITK